MDLSSSRPPPLVPKLLTLVTLATSCLATRPLSVKLMQNGVTLHPHAEVCGNRWILMTCLQLIMGYLLGQSEVSPTVENVYENSCMYVCIYSARTQFIVKCGCSNQHNTCTCPPNMCKHPLHMCTHPLNACTHLCTPPPPPLCFMHAL